MNPVRGDVYNINLPSGVGSEQTGTRPVVVIQNNVGNHYSPTVIVAVITSSVKKNLPTHVTVSKEESGMPFDSIVLAEQIRTVDKSRFTHRLNRLSKETMQRVDVALRISMGLMS
jgi:mRNA interferase MazF